MSFSDWGLPSVTVFNFTLTNITLILLDWVRLMMSGKINKIVACAKLASLYIDGIAQRLKKIKRNAYG